VLAGQAPYDDLNDAEQALVRVAWDKQIAQDIDEMDLAERLCDLGRPWYEADADGTS